MHPPLTHVDVRILGALVEKQATTPDVYPLSLSALAAACNQTSNREPVMRLDEDTIAEALVGLRRRGLLRPIQPSGSRVTKYEHAMTNTLDVDARELAVLAVLMLRGPQTVGELHTRTARLAAFASLTDVEATLESLIARDPEPLAARLARRAGQKEARYAHLLSGEPVVSDASEGTTMTTAATATTMLDDARVAALERTVDALQGEVAALRAEFETFRAQFG